MLTGLCWNGNQIRGIMLIFRCRISSREIEKQKDALLDDISLRLEQITQSETLFAIRWALK
jgi:hypothetical protein